MNAAMALERLCEILGGEDRAPLGREVTALGTSDAPNALLALCDALEKRERLVRVDWKESPREVGPLLAALARRVALHAKRLRWSPTEFAMDTDEFLAAAGTKLSRQGLSLVSLITDSDDFSLVIAATEQSAELPALARSCGWSVVVHGGGLAAGASASVPTGAAGAEPATRPKLASKRRGACEVGTFDVGMDLLALPDARLLVIDDRKLHLLEGDRATTLELPRPAFPTSDRRGGAGVLFRADRGFGLFCAERVLLWNELPVNGSLRGADRDLPIVGHELVAAPSVDEHGRAIDAYIHRTPVTAALLEGGRELFVVVTDSYRSFVGRLTSGGDAARWSASPSELPDSALIDIEQRTRPGDSAYRFSVVAARAHEGERVRLTLAGRYGHTSAIVEIDAAGEIRIVARLGDSPSVTTTKDGRVAVAMHRKKGKVSLELETADGHPLGSLALTKKLLAPIAWDLIAQGWWRVDILESVLWFGGVRYDDPKFWKGHYIRLELPSLR